MKMRPVVQESKLHSWYDYSYKKKKIPHALEEPESSGMMEEGFISVVFSNFLNCSICVF